VPSGGTSVTHSMILGGHTDGIGAFCLMLGTGGNGMHDRGGSGRLRRHPLSFCPKNWCLFASKVWDSLRRDFQPVALGERIRRVALWSSVILLSWFWFSTRNAPETFINDGLDGESPTSLRLESPGFSEAADLQGIAPTLYYKDLEVGYSLLLNASVVVGNVVGKSKYKCKCKYRHQQMSGKRQRASLFPLTVPGATPHSGSPKEGTECHTYHSTPASCAARSSNMAPS
jgi:hypothetical protein